MDHIGISAAGFGLPGGIVLSLGTSVGAGRQLVYAQASGLLAWDDDGVGPDAAVALAYVIGKPALTAADLLLVA